MAEPVHPAVQFEQLGFVRFVIDMVDARQEAEDAFFAGVDPETGEV